MNLDYSPAEKARRRAVRRSVFAAGLCAISLAALTMREGTASRQDLQALPIESDENAAVFPSDDQANPAAVIVEESLQPSLAEGERANFQASEWIAVTVKSGQAISTIIEEHGMLKYEWMELMALGKEVSRLKSLRAGDKLLLKKNAEGELDELQYEIDDTRTLHVQRVDGKLDAYVLAAEIERRPAQTAAIITSSLFADGVEAGLSNGLIMDMAEIFGYDIDFALDLREGDRFSVIYEELYKNGNKLRDGNILAAEFVNQGRTYRALRHTGQNGRTAYYTPEGQAVRKAFFRTPLDFARITSRFNLKRRHPILNIIRAHKGVDYAAATGTPIKATGDGKVAFIGVKGGYGNVVILQHGSRYTTLYAHMSKYRKGLRVGASVSRGQVIGYVGRSGLATAPHLHYEFRVNGTHVNPVKATQARAEGLPAGQIAAWREQNAALVAQLDQLSATQVAQLAKPATVKR